jgi:hypothetical protein
MFKLFGRKSSFKKDSYSAIILINEIQKKKPVVFLEVGVYQGVTSRNVCELLNKIHLGKFQYIGVDIFDLKLNKEEFTTKHDRISNPFKWIYFNFIKKNKPDSFLGVKNFLSKFEENVELHRGFSENTLPILDLSKVDFCFLDGGHSYETVKNDLTILTNKMKKNSIIICDDYDQVSYGVKRAVDELLNIVTSIENLNERLVKITV